MIHIGLHWRDATSRFGLHITGNDIVGGNALSRAIYSRFICWSWLGMSNKIFSGVATKGRKPDQLMIDETHIKVYRSAASLIKKGPCLGVSDVPLVA